MKRRLHILQRCVKRRRRLATAAAAAPAEADTADVADAQDAEAAGTEVAPAADDAAEADVAPAAGANAADAEAAGAEAAPAAEATAPDAEVAPVAAAAAAEAALVSAAVAAERPTGLPHFPIGIRAARTGICGAEVDPRGKARCRVCQCAIIQGSVRFRYWWSRRAPVGYIHWECVVGLPESPESSLGDLRALKPSSELAPTVQAAIVALLSC